MIQRFRNESLNENNYPVYMFKRSSLKDIELFELEPEWQEDKETKRERLILCGFCSNIITSPKYVIEVNGKHNHTFSNPAGNTFRIGCFSSAKGCLNYGEPTAEYTWFPGFSWRYAVCSGCYIHLGWHYTSQESSFYGLILKNLMEGMES